MIANSANTCPCHGVVWEIPWIKAHELPHQFDLIITSFEVSPCWIILLDVILLNYLTDFIYLKTLYTINLRQIIIA